MAGASGAEPERDCPGVSLSAENQGHPGPGSVHQVTERRIQPSPLPPAGRGQPFVSVQVPISEQVA